MHVPQTSKVYVPWLYRASRTTTTGNELIVENLMGLHYVLYRMLPNIKNNIVKPFEQALIDNARNQAMQEGKTDLEGRVIELHKERYTSQSPIMIDTTLSPETRVAYKRVIDMFRSYVEITVMERERGTRKDGVIGDSGKTYIEATQLRRMMKLIHDKPSWPAERRRIIVKNATTEEEIEPPKVTSLDFVMDPTQNATLSPENLTQYFNALGMMQSLLGFARQYKSYYMQRNSVTIEGLEVSVQKDHPLSKGGIIRMLFYPRKKRDYREAYHELANDPAKVLVPNTGDIDILSAIKPNELPEPHERGESKLNISIEGRIVNITRERKSHEPITESYNVIFNNGKLYVSADDVLDRIKRAVDKHTERQVRLKVDPILPEPSRKRKQS